MDHNKPAEKLTTTMSREDHWNSVYSTKAVNEVSWFESEPQPSLDLILLTLPDGGAVVDIGGGASRLVDRLLAAGIYELTVLDVSQVAIDHARARLAAAGEQVRWIVCDVTKAANIGTFDLWHDRAVFHFLTTDEDRRAYVNLAARTVRQGGFLIISTFATDGPKQCSGLDTCQYSFATLGAELSPHFAPVRSIEHRHVTPAGKQQAFLYAVFRRIHDT
jgi:SAM-dependent methyltransferase